jgi:hypothetical protein
LGKLRSYDTLLAAVVLVIIGLMIRPVPTWLLDILLTVNLALAAVLLMTSVLTPFGPQIYTYPSLLVINTLFRLGLDISSMWLILAQADAGQVVRSFGEFAADDMVIVGLVVFLMVAMVNLIFISKGAERSAEVTAHLEKGLNAGTSASYRTGPTTATPYSRASCGEEAEPCTSGPVLWPHDRGHTVRQVVVHHYRSPRVMPLPLSLSRLSASSEI